MPARAGRKRRSTANQLPLRRHASVTACWRKLAFPLTWWDTVKLYDEPGGQATELEQDTALSITLTGEPECLADLRGVP
jgi:hypothetical protein